MRTTSSVKVKKSPRLKVEVYQEALEGSLELDDRHGEGQTLGNLGELYTKCGSWTEAKENLERSLSILQEWM